ncbi:putative rho GDP-dissociation inhibitor 1-like [Capsicum annuum]|nr:putative rho GDP-dissociation inhibitor 1-like [Capsicum annuum]
MAQLLSLRVSTPSSPPRHPTTTASLTRPAVLTTRNSFTYLQHKLQCNGRFSCLFSHNRNKQVELLSHFSGRSIALYGLSYGMDEARKALESALGGKKNEFEKWDKEIKRREEAGGGDNSGGGGWFNWRRWFGGDDGHFWQEAQQATLAILGILVMYLIVAKGDVILAVIFNPLLFTLRGARNGFTFVTSKITRKLYPASQDSFGTISPEEVPSRASAKDSVARKWGSD